MSIIEYEVTERVAVITLNRPERRNAQNAQLLKDLDAAFDRAVAEKEVRVIVLKAAGDHFSAGHDLSDDARNGPPWNTIFDDVKENGLLGMYKWELGHYFRLLRANGAIFRSRRSQRCRAPALPPASCSPGHAT